MVAVLLSTSVAQAAVNHPFGSHPFTYVNGAIRPNHVTQAQLDQAVRTFYDAWKAQYLVQTCGPGRWVVRANAGGGNLTVSEAHGYGMIIMALMAGHDPQAQQIFDGMFAYFRDHPSAITPSLMAWNQNDSCQSVGGVNTASDGDLDIAYALLLADKQWGSCGAVNYLAEAQNVIAGIKSGDLDQSGQYVKLGDWAHPSNPWYYDSTRSSDFMPDHYRSFLNATGDPVWTNVLNRTYQIVASLQASHSPATGLLPDFVRFPLGTPEPAPPGFLEDAQDGAYDYNACRDPLRLGTDFLVSGDARAKTALDKINAWIRNATGGNPSAIRAGYRLDGTPSPGTDYRSMAFIAPFGVGAMVDATNQAWLNAIWDLVVATPIGAEHYYENTLKLLSMIVMSGNWWPPQAVTGGCEPSGNSLCTGGGTMQRVRIQLGRLGGKPNDETLQLRARIFFPQGVPVTSLTEGAQIRVEDLGAGSAAIFDLTEEASTPVPAVSAGVCDAKKDGWKVTKVMTRYRNGSTALDPPTCTAGSARGLALLKYRKLGDRDLDVVVQVRKSSLPTPVGPLRATLVLGATQAAGDAGACGTSAPVACSGKGGVRRCK
ncbi:MAG TPA: glycosyl hydrolase family 8 [Candidatus Binatia bacterium]